MGFLTALLPAPHISEWLFSPCGPLNSGAGDLRTCRRLHTASASALSCPWAVVTGAAADHALCTGAVRTSPCGQAVSVLHAASPQLAAENARGHPARGQRNGRGVGMARERPSSLAEVKLSNFANFTEACHLRPHPGWLANSKHLLLGALEAGKSEIKGPADGGQ